MASRQRKHAAPLLARALTRDVGARLRATAGQQNGPHRPSACRDADCLRPLCVVYKQGFEDGYAAGASAAADD